MSHLKVQWTPQRLDDLGFLGRGKSRHRPRNDERLYGGKYPFIQTADVMRADPYITDYSHTYSDFGFQQSKLWPANTLCITIAGANTAKTAILKFEACFPDSIVGFIPDQRKADLHFVKYALDIMKDKFLAVTRGATQDNLSLDKLLSFPILTPPLEVQRRIASILSAYDDLIENNLRRIRILEEMPRLLYREWFMDFRFPGHKSNGSASVAVPVGWKLKQVRELCSVITRGISPSYDEEGSSLVLNQRCIRDRRINLDAARRQRKVFAPEKQVRFGDVLINSTGVGTLGRVAQIYQELEACTVDSHVTIARRKPDVDVDFFGCTLLNLETIFERLGVGATGQTELSRMAISNVDVVVPPQHLQQQFGRLVSPIRHLPVVLMKEIDNLRRTRDLLLSRLMSSQLDVSLFTESLEDADYATANVGQ